MLLGGEFRHCFSTLWRSGHGYTRTTCGRLASTLTAAELDVLLPEQPVRQVRSARSLYHAILVQLKLLPDSECANLIRLLVHSRYVMARNTTDDQKIARLKLNAKKCLITLQKANVGDSRAFVKVIETAYGQRGRYKHQYMAAITSELTQPMEELIPGDRRSRPPAVGQRLQALWSLQFESKKIKLTLPLGPGGEYGKPLDKRREANLRWQHHTALLEQTMPPIPAQQHARLKDIATGTVTLCPGKVPRWRCSTIAEMNGRRTKHSTDGHHLLTRNIRRHYARILAKSPVLRQTATGSWSAYYDCVEPRSSDMIASQRPASDFELILPE